MSKVIKLVTRMGGEEVVVGTCHPGQARILRKNGMAEWDKGKLVLANFLSGHSSVPERSPEFFEAIKNLKPGELLVPHPDGSFEIIEGADPWVPYGIAEKKVAIKGDSWLDEVDFIDPKEELTTYPLPGGSGWNEGKRLHPEEIRSESLVEWVTEAKVRREAGHPLLLADEPRRMMLGFVDDQDNKVFLLSLRKVKEATEDDLQQVGATRADFSTEEGRVRLILGSPPEEGPSGAYMVVGADPELEALWIQDVEDTVGEEVRQGESTQLSDEWAKAAKFEPLEGGE